MIVYFAFLLFLALAFLRSSLPLCWQWRPSYRWWGRTRASIRTHRMWSIAISVPANELRAITDATNFLHRSVAYSIEMLSWTWGLIISYISCWRNLSLSLSLSLSCTNHDNKSSDRSMWYENNCLPLQAFLVNPLFGDYIFIQIITRNGTKRFQHILFVKRLSKGNHYSQAILTTLNYWDLWHCVTPLLFFDFRWLEARRSDATALLLGRTNLSSLWSAQPTFSKTGNLPNVLGWRERPFWFAFKQWNLCLCLLSSFSSVIIFNMSSQESACLSWQRRWSAYQWSSLDHSSRGVLSGKQTGRDHFRQPPTPGLRRSGAAEVCEWCSVRCGRRTSHSHCFDCLRWVSQRPLKSVEWTFYGYECAETEVFDDRVPEAYHVMISSDVNCFRSSGCHFILGMSEIEDVGCAVIESHFFFVHLKFRFIAFTNFVCS